MNICFRFLKKPEIMFLSVAEGCANYRQILLICNHLYLILYKQLGWLVHSYWDEAMSVFEKLTLTILASRSIETVNAKIAIMGQDYLH
jgi:hypothetical protein